MELVKKNHNVWDPFDMLTDLQHDLNRVFDRSLKWHDGRQDIFRPDIAVAEEKDRYLVEADIPGLKKENLNIAVEGNVLTIRGERTEKQETKGKGYFYSERSFGSFSRSLELPAGIDPNKVKAAYKDGVLEIEVPKSENAKPKQIEVEVK